MYDIKNNTPKMNTQTHTLRITWKVLLSIALFSAILYSLYHLIDILFAMVISLFLMYLCIPLLKKLEQKLPRIASVLVIFSAALMVFIIIL